MLHASYNFQFKKKKLFLNKKIKVTLNFLSNTMQFFM